MTPLARSLHPPMTALAGSASPSWVNTLITNRAMTHVLFWLSIFLFHSAYISLIGDDRDVSLYNLALRMPFILGCCYFNLYVLIPRFYYRGLLLVYGVLVLTTIFAVNGLNLLLLEAFVESPLCPTTFEADPTFNGSNFLYKSFYLFSIVGLTSGIKLSKDQYATRQQADAIEREKLQTELSFLKSQIHPHFFFNTLNNLYALIIKKSDLAPDMLLKLSDLMSYGLYEADAAAVPLAKELEHISNYIELESLRLGSRLRVQWAVQGDTAGQSVPPLIFLPFIENCFKHAASRQPGQQIVITLVIDSRHLTLTTSNPYDDQRRSPDPRGGLGLKHAHRRLQLLYGAAYRVESHIADGHCQFIVQIPL